MPVHAIHSPAGQASMSATSSDIGSSHQNPRRRPSFVFWDRSRKNSSASAHPPSSDPPQPSQQTSSSLTPSHAAAPQSSMDETQSSASSSPAIMGLDMEVVERERQSMDRQWEETQARLVGSSRIDGLAGLGLGGDDGSEGGRAPELSTQLPVQSFDAFSLPEFTDSSATSDSGPHLSASSFGNSSTPSASGKARGHSQSVSEAGSSTQQRDATSSSSRNPYEHGRGSVGALLQTHEYMQRSSSYQSKSSSSNSRRTSREVSFAVPGPSRSSSKADGRESRQGHHRAAPDRQHPEDGDVPTLEEGADAEEPSEGETFTHDLARSRRRRRLLRNTMRRRSKRKSGVSRGSGSLKLGGEGGHNDGLEWWESSDAISSSEDGNDAGLSEGSLSGRREGSGDVEDVTVTVTPVTPTMSSRNGGRHRSSSRRASSPPDTNRLTASSVKSSPTASSRSYTTSADSSADMYYDAEDQDQDQDPSKMRASEEELRGGDVELQARRKHSSTTGNASKLKITPGLSEPSSSATLRQDALDRASRGSSYSTHSHSSPESALGSSQAGDSTLRSPTTSVSTAPSPISPASPEFGALLSSPPTSRMFVRPSGALRTHRIGALPPARPSPTSPLPSVPASPPSDKPSREERGLPSSARTSLSGAGMASSTAMMQLTSLGDVKGRTRSQSLGQAAEGLQRPGSPLPTAMPQQQTSREAMQRARSSSHVARVDQPSSHTRFQLPDQPQHQRSSYIAGSQSGARGSAPHLLASPMPSGTSLKESGRAYTVPTPAAGTSLGPNGTVRGRPRGATIGALPPSGHSLGGAGRITVPTRARPRSLLCNEMVLPTEQPSEGQGSSSRTREPSVMMTSSTSSPAELVSSSPASIPSGSTTSASASAYTGSSLASAASSGTSISASTLDDSGELRRSVAEAIAGASGGTSEVSSGGIALMGTSSSSGSAGGAVGAGERKGGSGSRSRSGSNASLLQQVQYPPKSHASFVIAVVGHRAAGKSTVIKKGLRQFGLSKPNVLSEKVTSHSTVCVVDQEQRTIEVLEVDASVLLNGPGKRFAWPKFLPHIDAVILCYDAGHIASFRGMSELLENFSISNLSTVMLACKSEIFPKAVDPYYASDMAAVYNVGLAECTVESEEGKKRMRDCFSYLVKEVAKSRNGRQKRGNSAQQSPSASPAGAASASSSQGPDDDASTRSLKSISSQGSLASSTRDRNNSGASSTTDSIPVTQGERGTFLNGLPGEPFSPSSAHPQSSHGGAHGQGRSMRKLSDATTTSEVPSLTGSNSEDEAALQHVMTQAKLGLQSAKAAGGYVSIDELWDKLFFAGVSGNDERFLLMFMVFYRGFARPIDLLRQMVSRFESLASSEPSDGVMIRFSLMRLTAMLGDWVQDYPGDLSNHETYALLWSFYERLLQHSSTTYVAAPLRSFVEAARNAPDPDAVWSKLEDSVQPASVAAQHPPLKSHQSEVDSASAALKSASSKGTDVSSSAAQTVRQEGSNSFEESGALVRAPSDGSSSGVVDVGHLAKPADDTHSGRQRSASDLTTSSNEGQRSALSVAGGSSSNTSSSNLNSAAPSSSSVAEKPQDQKPMLRSISNALAELDDELIAAQLSRLEWDLFSAIRPRDLLRHILVSRDVREKNGPVARSIAHFNYISSWVCSMILVQGKTKHRARMLEKFMNVAAILRHDNNYNTLHSVLAGLGNASVHRLKHTRELLTGKPVNKTYQSLARLMGSDRSFAAYRLALENSEGRTIPYLGVHLQDILSISDGNPSKRASDGMVHWKKFSLMDEAVMVIVKCQQYERVTRPNAAVERLIMDVPVMDEEALYERSLAVEPRASQSSTMTSSKIKKFMSGSTS